MTTDFRQEFIRFTIGQKVLRFGEFKTKAGRLSPYFFDAGLFYDGAALKQLAQFYAKAILAADVPFDMLFGPAYKGIPLVAAIVVALAGQGRNLPFAFNRKEAKDHGEGGAIVGAPLAGRVLIVDDVISAGTSVRESVVLIKANGAEPCGVMIALDRQERGGRHLLGGAPGDCLHLPDVVRTGGSLQRDRHRLGCGLCGGKQQERSRQQSSGRNTWHGRLPTRGTKPAASGRQGRDRAATPGAAV